MLPQGMLELTRSQRATTTPDLHRKCLRSRRSARKDCGWGIAYTVGADGGWNLGGGHSALSPQYGLGVDSEFSKGEVLSSRSDSSRPRMTTSFGHCLRGSRVPC